jgi:hypothetical protein
VPALAESSQHTALVKIIVSYIGREHANLLGLGLLNDLSSPIGAEKPNRIEGFVPDVCAFDAPLTTMIIGEAKTHADLETAHSKRQIAAFLTHLQYQPSGIFILAVPWQIKRRAEALVGTARRTVGATSVKTVTLDDLGR